jgi:hypothetical protein
MTVGAPSQTRSICGLATLKAHPMIRSVTGSNNRVSPSSLLIPLIRLKKSSLPTAPTPDGARMSYAVGANEQ